MTTVLIHNRKVFTDTRATIRRGKGTFVNDRIFKLYMMDNSDPIYVLPNQQGGRVLGMAGAGSMHVIQNVGRLLHRGFAKNGLNEALCKLADSVMAFAVDEDNACELAFITTHGVVLFEHLQQNGRFVADVKIYDHSDLLVLGSGNKIFYDLHGYWPPNPNYIGLMSLMLNVDSNSGGDILEYDFSSNPIVCKKHTLNYRGAQTAIEESMKKLLELTSTVQTKEPVTFDEIHYIDMPRGKFSEDESKPTESKDQPPPKKKGTKK